MQRDYNSAANLSAFTNIPRTLVHASVLIISAELNKRDKRKILIRSPFLFYLPLRFWQQNFSASPFALRLRVFYVHLPKRETPVHESPTFEGLSLTSTERCYEEAGLSDSYGFPPVFAGDCCKRGGNELRELGRKRDASVPGFQKVRRSPRGPGESAFLAIDVSIESFLFGSHLTDRLIASFVGLSSFGANEGMKKKRENLVEYESPRIRIESGHSRSTKR